MFIRHSWFRAFAALAVIVLLPLGVGACAKDKTKEQQKTTEGSTDKGGAEAPQPGKAMPVDSVMPYYEIIRTALARDDAAAAAKGAAELRDAATAARDSAPDAMKSHLDAMATQAGTMADMKPENIDAMRTTFGEISRPMIMMMRAMPDVAGSYHMFECSMAKGYKYWVQKDAKIANPYMGTAMLECGAKVGMMHDKQGGN